MKTETADHAESTAKRQSTEGFLEPPKRVALYARVSAINGHEDPEVQLRELRQFAEARGWTVFAEFVDKGVSGRKDRRPALDMLMTAARGRKFDVVLVWKIGKFTRSLKHLVNAVSDFQALGVQFVSVRDNIDHLTIPRGLESRVP
jgi:DNA invertase Pin-like site-specific DNA recombinase